MFDPLRLYSWTKATFVAAIQTNFPWAGPLDTSCEGQLVVGMEAYASTKVVSLASTSIPPYQPEVDIQDLSVSDMSAQMNNVDAFQSSGQNDSSASSTQHPVVSASVDKRQDLDQPGHHAIDLHSKEDEDNFMRPVASSELESAKVAESVGARNTTPHVVSSASAPTAVDPGDTLTPDMTTISQPAMLPRKRQLPESILRSKNDSENEGPVHLRQRQTSPKDKGNGGASMSSTKTLTLSPKPSLSAGSTQQAQEAEVNPSGLEEAQVELQPADMENDSDAQSDASIDAAEYLDTIRGQIDEDLPLLAVDITDIALTLKQFGK
ncbi:hypothetical protein BG011_000638 [Mortierella polycephala]|uniref:Uncharacterized protein n=1 Tax=Mortierella polycephala TaxID=41804 RepID=A0A9P6Q6T2_9FUNG|nr:hypothetical protein BG011_000638 [Mortierella polycephala]